MRVSPKFFIGLYVFSILALFFYSFTQVDLSLTLSRLSIWQTIEKQFQYIGYFQRPFSTHLYVTIIGLLFFCYGYFLILVKRKELGLGVVWRLIFFTTIILAFSYNAFSYDLFNYIFDAKIITHYHLNPYNYKALDFPGDPMLSFMHWTHRTYPYGPAWLLLTVPLSFIGMQIFLPTFFLFKFLMAGSYLLACWSLMKLAQKTVGNEVFVLTAFAFNPLVIVESLVSAHNDIVMMALMLVSLVWFVEKKYTGSIVTFLLSVGVKFATGLLLSVFLFVKKKPELAFSLSLVLMLVAVLFATMRTNFQPWYVLYALPFAALLSKKYYVLIPTFIISIAGLCQYVPFLFTGNWNPPIPMILNNIMAVSIVVSVLLTGTWFIKTGMMKK